ncbi:MAG: aminodeoxychorismate synthase component I [Ilumatobacteraceae bacterium]
MSPRVRLDDLSSPNPSSWEFHEETATGRAECLADVTCVLVDAERRAAAGDWVVFVISYEAAGAFDPALRTKPAPPDGTPVVWWSSFAERRRTDRVAPVASHVIDRHRAINVHSYPEAVEMIRDRIALGDVYQVNMTDRFEGHYEGEPIDLYAGLLGVQSCSHGAYIEMGERVVASASPELFFRVEGDVISCRPMKGTAPRHPRTDLDRQIGDALTKSVKDQAENVMIVDLLRNDLSRVAELGTVVVPHLFQLERYETVWQLTSTVTAGLARRVGLVDLLRALFPCGSITGAPKISAMHIVDELEQQPRGVYCGAIGVLAPPGHEPRIECSVPIRTAVLNPAEHTFVYGAGGGITWSSEPDAEDDEVRHKARILTRSHRRFQILETLRLDSNGPVHADLHMTRMGETAEWFGFDFDRLSLQSQLASLRADDVSQRLRLLLDSNGVIAIEHHPLIVDEGPVLVSIDTEITRSDDPFSCHKTTYRRHYDEARRRHPDADDVVLVNERGHAIEATIANLAYRIGGDWFVPPLDDGGLAGIGRHVALGDCRVSERPIRAADLARCDELAVINDLRGWRRAILID